jgi:ammonium transporter, Amt family
VLSVLMYIMICCVNLRKLSSFQSSSSAKSPKRTRLLMAMQVGFISLFIMSLAGFSPDSMVMAQEATHPVVEPIISAPSPDKADITWMLVSTILVICMTIPGLALFYAGLTRAKNVLSMMTQVFSGFCLMSILWITYGYSVAFSAGNPFWGGFSKTFLTGVMTYSHTGISYVNTATFSKGVVIPEIVFALFQLTFATITPALIIGAFAERVKLRACMLFLILWFTFAYLPIAHMVWYWDGPDAFVASKGDLSTAGFLFGRGVLDFAGGTVVHINAGIAGLVCAILSGKRLGYGEREEIQPHSMPLAFIGACLLWIGWFGFNVGSNLEANGTAGLALLNTLLAPAVAVWTWLVMERFFGKGYPTLLGALSGAIAGLVGITPAAGFSGVLGAILIGVASSVACFYACTSFKHKMGYDDSLDVFGVHGVAGIIGALMTGIVVSPALGGTGIYDYLTDTVSYEFLPTMMNQAMGVVITCIWSALVSFIAYKLVDKIIGCRVPEQEEKDGLDVHEQHEKGYH